MRLVSSNPIRPQPLYFSPFLLVQDLIMVTIDVPKALQPT